VVAAQPEGEAVLRLGYLKDSPPFSYERNGAVGGYSIDICRRIAEVAINAKNYPYSAFEFEPVTAGNRFKMLNERKIDLLCEATTVTLERMREFDSTLYTFLSGVSFAYRVELRSMPLPELLSKQIGFLEGTTAKDFLANVQAKIPGIEMDLVNVHRVPDHFAGLKMLENEQIDAYFADREILLALTKIARSDFKLELEVSSEYLSYEPYALFTRRDAAGLLFLANRTLVELFKRSDDSIEAIFARHFEGKRMSPSLRELFRLQQIPVGRDPLHAPLVGQ
jgi:polar amino acid transport system substrate-binding protein/glutamate/aspartate transport system substrate-binding protein